MPILDRVTEIVTGKTKQERAEEARALRGIRRDSRREYLEAKRKESLTLARERARIEREHAVKKLRNRQRSPNLIASFASAQPRKTSSPFGYPGVSTVIGGGYGRTYERKNNGNPNNRKKKKGRELRVSNKRNRNNSYRLRSYDPVWGSSGL